MQHAKNFVLIPEDQLIKNTPRQQQEVTQFDQKMSKILKTSENPALEYEHPVQKDESGKWKEEIKTKVGENYIRIILESLSKT
ncbi:hypothetical protein TNCV_1195861 [Trichonephila clavipes]|uniref:Uncharacterized protein n=1 Tax=Trichonephila clavipes TaxID=2585209 RepID=A0A8X6RZW0_TRICX|nr:hypothetical protein TNCV_1195861 [Trichonephila clavipes]